jgi:hypothetical protein
MPSGIDPSSSAYSSRHTAYGPAISATRYVDMISLVAKVCTDAPPELSSVAVMAAFDTTSQSAGAVTVSV